jgi:NhaP-type Na+/H+ or K+/H+ antiporter
MAYSLAVIILMGLLADYVFRRFKLPGLVGMLIVGVLVGPYVWGWLSPAMMAVSADFRKIALIVILLRAGFELRRDALHRVGWTAVTMSAVPAVFEIIGVMLAGRYFLDLSYLDAAILGSILAAVSPAVVVPLMIDFMEQGRGSKKAIPTLILGASSLDDVFVIVVFTVLLGMATGENINMMLQLSHIPISVVLGIALGVVPGLILARLFIRFDWRPPKRTLVVLGVAISLTWIEHRLEGVVPVAALLGVMAIGFIVLEKSEPIAHQISGKLKKVWVFAELLLFVLVGAQVNIEVAWRAGLAGLGVIAVGLVFRSIGSWVSLAGAGFNAGEKLFCIVAYIPKATVQAAIGALPMAAGLAAGETILAVAVLSIVVTAPLGAIGIKILGRRVLDHGQRSAYRFKALRQTLALPHVGERLLHRPSGEVWKVIEEKEVWLEQSSSQNMDDIQLPEEPSIYQRYWKADQQVPAGKGQTRELYFTRSGQGIKEEWEILFDW